MFLINKTSDYDFKKNKINFFNKLKSPKNPKRRKSNFIKINSVSSEENNYNGNTLNHLKTNFSNDRSIYNNYLGINYNK